MAAGRRGRQAGAVRRRGAGACAQAGRGERPAGTAPRAWRCRRSSARRAPTRCATSTCTVQIDRARRTRHVHRARRRRRRSRPTSPASRPPAPTWWPLAMARELDDAILLAAHQRARHRHLAAEDRRRCRRGARRATQALRAPCATTGSCARRIGLLRRTLARLDVSSRTLFALIEPGSCFAGTLAELAFAADRSYMLALPDDAARAPKLTLSDANFGAYPMVNGQTPPGAPLLRRGRAAARRASRRSASRSTPTPRSRSASSPRRPTTSTGPTRCASRSRSASRCRPMR